LTRPLHFGVALGAIARADDGRWQIARFTKAIELADALGFDGVWLSDSYAGGGPDPLVALAHVANVTERLRIGTAILLLPLHHPTTVARQAASLDALSGGRLTLGVGVGGDRGGDFELVGMGWSERGARFDEGLEILGRLWSGEEVDHVGAHYQIRGRLRSLPVQQPVPVLIGGRGGKAPSQQRAYRRVVEVGGGWLPYIMTPAGYARGVEAIRGLGCPDPILGLVEMAYVGSGDGSDALREAALRKAKSYGGSPERFRNLVLAGNAATVVARLKEFADLGVTEFVLSWACDPREIEDQMRILAGEVIPAVRAHAAARGEAGALPPGLPPDGTGGRSARA
jgi:alkanesulfonate monooxygenase SsuD/methylene tetrahydromethanopterin reductase-like flavin-dependent oxidoreductase (luciferase family)